LSNFYKIVLFKFSGTSDNEEGLGHGLGLIIDKLKNIETKLDELKTLDQVFTN
jgi:hypothetical protein